MSREARFACWVAAIALGITAPLWSALSGGASTPTMVGVTLNALAVLGIIALVITTPPDAIRVSPMTNWFLLAAGLAACHVVGKSGPVTFAIVGLAILWTAFPPRVTLAARKLNVPEQALIFVHEFASTRIWSLVPLAWAPVFWAGPNTPFSYFNLTDPLTWSAIGFFAGGFSCCWTLTRVRYERWSVIATLVWAASVITNAALRLP